jgi:hypothetical protein
MRRALTFLLLAFILPCLGASLLLAGCGGANGSDYEREVSELNQVAAEKLEEPLDLLGEEVQGEEEERVEAVVAALEEAVTIINQALLELEEVKVPAGMEDFHRQLMSFYHANLATYEAYISALEPGSEQGEGEAHGEEEGAETHEEETAQEEEVPAGEEAPHQEEEPAESGGH